MSHFTKLLIDSYHLMRRIVRNCRACQHSASKCQACDDLTAQADKIYKRMKSLGHHNCWTEFGDEAEVELP